MNQIMVFSRELDPQGIVRISDPWRLTHLLQVLRVQVGEKLKGAIIDVQQVIWEVLASSEQEVLLKLSIMEKAQNEKHRPWVHLLVGLSRPPTMKKIIEHATTSGVGSMQFVRGKLSEKSYEQSKLWSEQQWQHCALAGLAQSAHYFHMPQVQLNKNLSSSLPFLHSPCHKFLLSPTADADFYTYFVERKLSFPTPIILAIGPERGWTSEEEEFLQQNNFLPVRVSSAILRVEICTFYALAQCELFQARDQSKDQTKNQTKTKR